MAELSSEKQFAVLMSAETFRRFRETDRQLYDQSESINLAFDQEKLYGAEIEAAIMTDEEVMQYLPLADIELRTAAAIIEDAARVEQENTNRLNAVTARLNSRAEQIESAADRLRKVLATPVAP